MPDKEAGPGIEKRGGMADKNEGNDTRAAGNAADTREPLREDGPLTEQALEAILTSPSIDAAASSPVQDTEQDLPAYLQQMMARKGLTQSELAQRSNLIYQRVYDAANGRRGIARDGALELCFGLGCTLREAQRLLWHAGAERLYARNRRDAIIIYALEHRMSLAQVEQALYEFGEKTLGGEK